MILQILNAEHMHMEPATIKAFIPVFFTCEQRKNISRIIFGDVSCMALEISKACIESPNDVSLYEGALYL